MVITGLRLAANSFWVARAVSPSFAGGSRKTGREARVDMPRCAREAPSRDGQAAGATQRSRFGDL